jgi:thiol-disulfide isomerase/thioredoxin
MTLGAWVLVCALIVTSVVAVGWTLTNGVFRGSRRVRGAHAAVVSTGSTDGGASTDEGASTDRRLSTDGGVLAGTAYDARRGQRATLLQFSSAFCTPCRATRRVLADVARSVPGVAHVEIDAEHHLDLVRALGVVRTPTTLVLDAGGHEVTRATGAPRPAQVLAALDRRAP